MTRAARIGRIAAGVVLLPAAPSAAEPQRPRLAGAVVGGLLVEAILAWPDGHQQPLSVGESAAAGGTQQQLEVSLLD